MGNLWTRLWKQRETRLLMFGLDAAGKTSILYKLKLGDIVTTIPTIGFNVETLNHKGVTFQAWDVGGRDKIRPLHRHYYPNTDAVLFVLDSADRERVDEALEELRRIHSEDELRDAIFILLANKQDLSNALGLDEIEDRVRNISWTARRTPKVFLTSVTSGEGLYETLDWLTQQIAIKHCRGSLLKSLGAGQMAESKANTSNDISIDEKNTVSSYFSSMVTQFKKLIM